MRSMSDHNHPQEEPVDQIDGEAVERPPKRLRRWMGRNPATLITDATKTISQHRHQREVVYTVLQVLRIPLLALAMVMWGVYGQWVVALLLLVVTVPLPGLAVVIANEQATKKDKRSQSVYKPAQARIAQQRREELAAPAPREIEAPETINEIEDDDIKDEDND